MARRFNVYLDDESEGLFNQLIGSINEERRKELLIMKEKGSICVKTYKPIGNSELIQQLIKKFYTNERQIIIDKLDYYCKQSEIYENKLKLLNKMNIDIKYNMECIKNE